jgi:hypothetical protein
MIFPAGEIRKTPFPSVPTQIVPFWGDSHTDTIFSLRGSTCLNPLPFSMNKPSRHPTHILPDLSVQMAWIPANGVVIFP